MLCACVCVCVLCVCGARNDWWLPCGIAGYIAGLFSRKISGSTEYQHWIMEVCMYGALCTLVLTLFRVSKNSTEGFAL